MILFLKRYWPVLLALAAITAAAASGYTRAMERAEAAQAKKQLAAALETIKVTKEAYAQDAKALINSKVREAELDAQISELSEYVSDLEDANHECLSGADTDQLRKLWR